MTPLLAISSGTVAVIVVIVVIDLFAIFFGLSFARSRKAQRQADAAAGAADHGRARAADAQAREPSRVLPPLARRLAGGVRRRVRRRDDRVPVAEPEGRVRIGDQRRQARRHQSRTSRTTNLPFYSGAGRFYIVPYAGKPEGDVDYATEGVTTDGIMPLYQRCVHLGCRVPFCQSSQWFECPCHGSKYNTAGEYKLGPAPHGMDRFKVSVTDSGDVLVDTAEIILGPPRGTDTTHKPLAGTVLRGPVQ